MSLCKMCTVIDTYWGHQLIAKPIYDDYQAKCVNSVRKNVKDCISLEIAIMNGVGNLNPYALDYPVCVSSSSNMKTGYAQRLWLLHSKYSAFLSKEEIKSMVLFTQNAIN